MKILLTKDVSGLGRTGDVKDVSDGHARNFLIPKHLALPATSSVLAQVQKEEQERQKKIAKALEQFLILKDKLENKTFTLKAKAGREHLFAAIKPSQIADAINKKLNTNISPNQVVLKNPVKTVGPHEAEIRFAQNAKALLKLNVEAQN